MFLFFLPIGLNLDFFLLFIKIVGINNFYVSMLLWLEHFCVAWLNLSPIQLGVKDKFTYTYKGCLL